jgi:hypothetical protein
MWPLFFLERLRREDVASENIRNQICKLRVNLNYQQNNSSLVPHVFFFSSIFYVFFYVLSNLHISFLCPVWLAMCGFGDLSTISFSHGTIYSLVPPDNWKPWADPKAIPRISGNTRLFWYTFMYICVYTYICMCIYLYMYMYNAICCSIFTHCSLKQ